MDTLAARLAPSSRHPAWAPILVGGMLSGAIDLLYAFAYYGAQGVAPTRILQSIASGLLGREAYGSLMPAVPIGLGAHFFILTVAAAMYYFASRCIAFLRERAYISGMLFGIAIYCTMHYVVVPLSAAPQFKSSLMSFLTDLSVHMLLLGPAISLTIRNFDRRAARQR
ncbi:MAG: hypothetical protein ACREPX_02700 [Rhodanobacteraceae bacterium]